MQLGWIDFSKTERDKILGVIDLLGEKGVLDELGIASIRDSFSNLFFPGITTIQTRAKYFLIVPYTLKDLELNNDKTYQSLANTLDNTEQECAKKFLKNNKLEQGVIGTVALKQGKWVQRTPASIYWTGLKQYNIFTNKKFSINEYIKFVAINKYLNDDLKSTTTNIPEESDDKDAGKLDKVHFLNIPTYEKDWKKKLKMDLTHNEAVFLKNQIIESCPNSMFAYILKKDLRQVLKYNSFKELEQIIKEFPEEIQIDYYKAKDFSDFVYVLRVLYNKIVSEDKNHKANKEFNKFNLKECSDIDINYLFKRLDIYKPSLKNFLTKTQARMKEEDVDGLKEAIIKREVDLKGINRAKTLNLEKIDPFFWYAGEELNYRFLNAKAILADIFRGCDYGA